jgi:hypothetical protein
MPTAAVKAHPSLEIADKPNQVTWRAKAQLYPDGIVKVWPDPDYDAEMTHNLDHVVVSWYEDCVKITFKDGAPAMISQGFITSDGRDVILEVRSA